MRSVLQPQGQAEQHTELVGHLWWSCQVRMSACACVPDQRGRIAAAIRVRQQGSFGPWPPDFNSCVKGLLSDDRGPAGVAVSSSASCGASTMRCPRTSCCRCDLLPPLRLSINLRIIQQTSWSKTRPAIAFWILVVTFVQKKSCLEIHRFRWRHVQCLMVDGSNESVSESPATFIMFETRPAGALKISNITETEF